MTRARVIHTLLKIYKLIKSKGNFRSWFSFSYLWINWAKNSVGKIILQFGITETFCYLMIIRLTKKKQIEKENKPTRKHQIFINHVFNNFSESCVHFHWQFIKKIKWFFCRNYLRHDTTQHTEYYTQFNSSNDRRWVYSI